MTRSRYLFGIAASLAVATIGLFSSAFSAALLAVERVVTAMFDALALPASFVPAFGRAALAGGVALAYDAPPSHALRHEAGVARRSAARNT